MSFAWAPKSSAQQPKRTFFFSIFRNWGSMKMRSLTIGQIIGSLIMGLTVMAPGLSLAGFHGGTAWPILGWVCVSIVGGFLAGLLLAPKHRFAGAVGGMIAA